MQYFFYCRDRAGAYETRKGLLKAHWAFMRPYIEAMIARGPTMSADGRTVTGSMHIVDLPDAAAAQVFAHDDPLAKGGVFENILVRRFENRSGRTMWQYPGNANNPQFLYVASAANDPGPDSLAAQCRYLDHADRADRVIVHGPLLAEDGLTWRGAVMLLETADLAAAEALIAADPLIKCYDSTALLSWRFGGEENLQDLIARK